MNTDNNIQIARSFIDGVRAGRRLDEIDVFIASDLRVDVQGDDGVLPWIGHKVGRQALAKMLDDQHNLIEPQSIEIDDIFGSDKGAVIVGSLRTLIKSTNRITSGDFAIVLTIEDKVVVRYQLIENSFDVARAAA